MFVHWVLDCSSPQRNIWDDFYPQIKELKGNCQIIISSADPTFPILITYPIHCISEEEVKVVKSMRWKKKILKIREGKTTASSAQLGVLPLAAPVVGWGGNLAPAVN